MLPHRLKTIADFARSMWNRRAYMQCTFAPFCTVGATRSQYSDQVQRRRRHFRVSL